MKQMFELIIPELGEPAATVASFFATEKTLHLPCPIRLVKLLQKIEKKSTPSSIPSPVPAPAAKRRIVKAGPVSTSTKQITSYTTVRGIYNEIKVREPEYPGFGVKELMENGYDFLQVFYPVGYGNTKETRKIAVRIKIEPMPSVTATTTTSSGSPVITHIIRIAVRNSNVDNIAVFEDLEAVFDYDNWYSTKRGQYRVTSGALGDYLKRSLGMSYALWTADFNPEDSLESKQWNEPTIFRYNWQERRVYIEVEPNQKVKPLFSDSVAYDAPNFTEVEIAMPVPIEWNFKHSKLLNKLKDYCRKARFSKIKTDISFRAEWDGGVMEL
jgi:hypothetical protein